MSELRAKEYLKKYNLDDKIIHLEDSSATVALAAAALGCKEEEIAKSLTFYGNEGPVLIVAAGDTKIDNKKFREYFHIKPKMIKIDELETIIGHNAGGVCPFGVNEDVNIYLDISLKRFEYVYPACGTSNNAIKLNVKDLDRIIELKDWIDVCKY